MKKWEKTRIVSLITIFLLNINIKDSVSANADVDAPLENPEEALQESLELPNIHENTLIYNGIIHPDFTLTILLPEVLSGEERSIDPEINEAGQFAINFAPYELEDEYSVEVLPAEEGQEIIESSADTSEVQDAVREATEINWLEENATPAFELSSVGDMDNLPFYSIMGEPISEETRIEHRDQNNYRANFSTDTLNIGDTITLYIVASGVTTIIETEVPENLVALSPDEGDQEEIDDPEEESEETEDLNGGEDDESDIEDENDMDEVDPPETEGLEDENEGMSTGSIIAGVVLGLAVVGGIVFALSKRKQ